MPEVNTRLQMDHGGEIELAALRDLFENLAIVAELGHEIDRRLARLAAERSLLSRVGSRSELAYLAERYLRREFQTPEFEKLIYFGYYRGPRGVGLPLFDRLVTGHMSEGQFDPSRTVLRTLSFRNPLDIELVTRLAEGVGPWLGGALGAGGLGVILRSVFGTGPEERANARIKRAVAHRIEESTRRQLRNEEPTLDLPPFSAAELKAVEELSVLDFELTTSISEG